MECLVLDELFRRSYIFENYKSFIWAERYSGLGDFEIVAHSTPETKALLAIGTRIAHNQSDYVMTVESIEEKTAVSGERMLTISGSSLESIFQSRIPTPTPLGPTTPVTETWVVEGTPGQAIREAVRIICRVGLQSPYDRIPYLSDGTYLFSGSILEPAEKAQFAFAKKPLFDTIKTICDAYALGFRLVRQGDSSQLYFDVYTGSDRTTLQAKNPAVVFSPELDNIQNTRSLKSIEKTFNVAYVYNGEIGLYVFPPGVDEDIDGFNRKVLYVEDTTLVEGTLEENAIALRQRGLEELSKFRQTQAFDGEISKNSGYRYGKDYFLGDLVELRDGLGNSDVMRVTEQIFVSDEKGARSYPTLELNSFVNAGSWAAFAANKQWIDYENDFDSVWANQL